MTEVLNQTIAKILQKPVDQGRKEILRPLISYIQLKLENREPINLNFICTHNSRRSHFAQIWAQTAATYFQIPNVFTYSGGTESTAVFPKVIETLKYQGFLCHQLSDLPNPVYAIKIAENQPAIIAFSKLFNDEFNPKKDFAAVMTCSQADEGCPYIPFAEKRFALTYQDPKISDNSPIQDQVYLSRSEEIAAELCYCFAQVRVPEYED